MTSRDTTLRGPTVEFAVHSASGHKGRRRLKRGKPPASEPVEPGNVPRVARLLALAHRMEQLVREGHVQNYAEIAQLGGLTRARITQVMQLLLLAPTIQEELLTLPRTLRGRDPVSERQLRPVVAEVDWSRQRQMWRETQGGRQPGRSA